MAKSKAGLKYAKIVRSSSGASAHLNARKGIVKDCEQNRITCLSRKSGITRESGTYSQRCSNYVLGIETLQKTDLTTQRSPTVVLLKNGGTPKASFEQIRVFRRT
jgi:hypothetical protein